MDLALLTVIGIVVVALLFDYSNGFHDSANSISTIVATRVLRPRLVIEVDDPGATAASINQALAADAADRR